MMLLNQKKIVILTCLFSGCQSFLLNNVISTNKACVNGNAPLFVSSSSESENTGTINRRNVLGKVAASVLLPSFGLAEVSNALDMDAFVNSELEKDNKQRDLTDDEALCKYGNAGKDRGEACARAGMSTAGKKKGSVDAYGKIDRGDFVRCKTSYPMIDGKYVKTVTCQ